MTMGGGSWWILVTIYENKEWKLDNDVIENSEEEKKVSF